MAGSKEIFVGNIPFTLSEDQIREILSSAGTVTSFRLMSDAATGKPRGYGFATYADADMASSAVRNLNDYEVGGRKIRVDWPHQQNKESGGDQHTSTNDVPTNGSSNNALPPIPQGIDLPSNLKATDAISQTLRTLPPQTLLDFLTQMKSLAISEPAKATELLRQQPQLSYAIFQALLLMGLVDEKIFQQVLEQPQQPRAAPMPTPAQPPSIMPQQPQHAPFPPPPHQFPGFPPPLIPGQQMPGVPPRPVQSPYGVQPGFTPQPPQPAAPAPQAQGQSHEQLIQQILSMDQRTIDSLPPTERGQVIAIRQSMGVR